MRTASLRVASDTAMSASARLRIRSAKSLSAATFRGECVSGSSQQVRSCTVAVSFARRELIRVEEVDGGRLRSQIVIA
jgi:hypothetical protein